MDRVFIFLPQRKLNIYVLGVGTTVRLSGLFCERRAEMVMGVRNERAGGGVQTQVWCGVVA